MRDRLFKRDSYARKLGRFKRTEKLEGVSLIGRGERPSIAENSRIADQTNP